MLLYTLNNYVKVITSRYFAVLYLNFTGGSLVFSGFKKGLKIFMILLVLCFLAVVYMFIEPYWFKTKYINLESENIPDSFDGKKIVFVADIHYGEFFPQERLMDLVERINALKPDIIFMAGDFIGRGRQNIEPCFNGLKNLKAPLGKYAVLGNHDYYNKGKTMKEAMKKADIKDLSNKGVWIRSGDGRIKVGGVEDLYQKVQLIEPTINDVTEDDFVILLSHNPDYAEQIQTDKVDIVLSGHTHGGQVTFFGLWAPRIPSEYGQKYRRGMVEAPNTKVYVTTGIGCTGIPMRFFARPQICVIKLVKTPKVRE